MRLTLRATIGLAVMSACFAGGAFADDIEGAYVGAGIGLGRIEAGTAGIAPSSENVDRTRFAYHLDFGIHPPSVPVALELEYLDLGQVDLPQPYAGPGFLSGNVSQRGEGLFLLYYLPTPIVQVYAKAGGSHITTHANFTYCAIDGCALYSLSPTNNAFAFGAGLQWTLGRWAVRGEYEHFNAGGGHPSLLTLGVDWTFL